MWGLFEVVGGYLPLLNNDTIKGGNQDFRGNLRPHNGKYWKETLTDAICRSETSLPQGSDGQYGCKK